MTIGNDKVEEDSSVKQEGEGETEPLTNEDDEAAGRAGGTDQSME